MYVSWMRFPEGKKKALTLSYDDGIRSDIRLIDIMRQYGLKGTFNINSGLYPYGGLTKEEVTELYKNSGMEVAAHGLHHLHMKELPIHLCLSEILKDRENLEEQFQTMVRGFAYPYASYNEQVAECLKKAGIAYGRVSMPTGNFRLPEDWLRLQPTCHHDDSRLVELAHRFVEEECLRAPWLFYVWGHSREFNKNDNWNKIEAFAEYIGNREDIWYATNIEIYDYVKAYESLIYSANGRHIYNPSAMRLYFENNSAIYEVGAGKEISV